MPTPSDIRSQRERLATTRRTLQHYLNQRTISGSANTRPEVTHGIDEARTQIRRIKATLRQWGEQVDDQPDDEDDPATDAGSAEYQPQGASQEGGVGGGSISGRARGGTEGDQSTTPPPSSGSSAVSGPPAWWERFRHHPMIFYPTVAFVTLTTIFGCVAMTISAGADFGGFRQQLQEWGFLGGVITPTASPTTTSVWRIYPNPDPQVNYVWYVWREPPGVPEVIAGATPTTRGDGQSWNRFRYDLAGNQFAGLALTFAEPHDFSAYRVLMVRVGFDQVSDRCRLYLKDAEPDMSLPTPPAGPPDGSNPGVSLSLGEQADRPGIMTTPEAGGVQVVFIDLQAQLARTNLKRVIEIGFEALPGVAEPEPGQCDIYEIALLP